MRDRSWLPVGRDAMRHRGPDDFGEWWSSDGRVGLGHRRLSVIDLSPAGHQPMADSSGKLHVAFNGEIYNFRELREQLAGKGHSFVSGSDTEVLLAAYREWDIACLQRLNGMFAFSLYDSQRGRLLLARDRAGEKPLFYRLDGGTIRFASELKALLADTALPRRVDRDALDCVLADGFSPYDRCALEGFRKLPAARALTFDVASGSIESWTYWQPPALVADGRRSGPSDEDLLNQIDTLLATAVRRQLVADVPVGVLLSGGVDSSLITAMAARCRNDVKTFTVRFPGHGAYDETEHARLIAKHFGTQHVEIDAEEAHVDLLSQLARQFDDPMIDSSMVPTYLVSRVIREHCTVAIGGDGGDELFGGYPHYDRMLRLQKIARAVPMPLRMAISRAAGRLMPVGAKGRNWAQALSTELHVGVPLIAQIFDVVTRARVMDTGVRWHPVAEGMRESRLTHEDDLLQRATRLDFQTYLTDDLLVKVDRASMLNSLEVRAPMLDAQVMDFAFGQVPSRLKATPSERKILLKRLAARVLPPEFDRARKQGFSIPLSSWLRAGPWRQYFKAVLLDSGATWFNRNVAARMLEDERRGRANSERLFALVMIELWRREYRVEMGA